MEITQSFLTVNSYSRPGRNLKAVKGIVVHYVGNTNSTAIANRNYFENLKNQTNRYASSQYIIGLQGEVIQCMPETEVAYHAGAKTYKQEVYDRLNGKPNDYTIGIECCHITDDGTMSTTTYNTLIELCANLCRKYGLNPATDLWRHYDVTGKVCHKWFVNNPDNWRVFKLQVAGRAGTPPKIVTTQSPTSDTPTVTITTTSQSVGGSHIVEIDDSVMTDRTKYENTKKLEGIQTNPKEMKTVNFKQDYVVVIRKKLYYAISAQDEEKYLRVYQVNNFVNIRTSHSVYGRPATCSISVKGGERVICAEQEDQERHGWESWQRLLKGWVGDSNTSAENDNWKVGQESWSLKGAPGIDFKNLLKAREAKYGWRFAEKCDWEPMDEIYVFGKARDKKYKKQNGDYEFLPLFFGYIDTVSKTYQSGQGSGLVINIQASDQLKLMQLSRVVNNPSKLPGVIANGGLDIRWHFPQDEVGCFAINDDFLNGNNVENNVVYTTLQNVFAGLEPYKFINRLALDAGIPEKYLQKRIEKITKIPFVPKLGQKGPGDFLNAETKSRIEVCTKAAEQLFIEFFADEEGNLVFKIPNYALGINHLKDNNMGYDYNKAIIDATGPQYVDENGNKVNITQVQADAQAAVDAGEIVETPQVVKETTTTIEYRVVSGDSLYKIAQKILGDGNKWRQIYEDNINVIGSNPNLVKVGQVLKIYKTASNNPQEVQAALKQASSDNKQSLQNTLNNKQIKMVQGKTLTEQTDKLIPIIKAEDLISFTLTDTDREIYNMYEVQIDTPLIEFSNIPQAIRRVVPDYNSIVRFGLRPHPGVINTPLISSNREAEIFGSLMIQRSLANRYTATVNMIEDSSIRIGDPIRIDMYDEHPFKETGLFPNFGAQAVFYITGIERSIDIKNVSYMTLQLKAGRMMGQESIFDIFMPLYKYYFDDVEVMLDFNFQEIFEVESSIKYEIKPGDTLSKIITGILKVDSMDGTKINDMIVRIVKLNLEYFGGIGVSPNIHETRQAGDIIKLPKNV